MYRIACAHRVAKHLPDANAVRTESSVASSDYLRSSLRQGAVFFFKLELVFCLLSSPMDSSHASSSDSISESISEPDSISGCGSSPSFLFLARAIPSQTAGGKVHSRFRSTTSPPIVTVIFELRSPSAS